WQLAQPDGGLLNLRVAHLRFRDAALEYYGLRLMRLGKLAPQTFNDHVDAVVLKANQLLPDSATRDTHLPKLAQRRHLLTSHAAMLTPGRTLTTGNFDAWLTVLRRNARPLLEAGAITLFTASTLIRDVLDRAGDNTPL